MKETEIKNIKGGGWKKKILLLALGIVFLAILTHNVGLFPSSAKKPKKIECLGGDALSAPVFTLPDLKGNKIDLVSFKGKVILIEFWATWCGPCREEIPHLTELYSKYRNDGLVVMGISLDRKEPQEVQSFLEKLGVEYINLVGNDEIFENYSRLAGLGTIRGIPATFLIDREGRICKSFMGLTKKQILEEAVQSIL